MIDIDPALLVFYFFAPASAVGAGPRADTVFPTMLMFYFFSFVGTFNPAWARNRNQVISLSTPQPVKR